MGQAFAEATAQSVAFNRRYLTTREVGRGDLERILAPFVAAASAAVPHLVEQVRGVAEGADQPFIDLFLANAFEEVYGIIEQRTPSGVPLDRCTDVVLRTTGSTLLGHNEQWYAGDDGEVGLVLDVSDDGPAVLAPVVAGTLPLVGLNELGGALGTMSLTAHDEHVGIPRALIAREVLDAYDPKDAFRRASRNGRAGGYSYLCAFPGGSSCAIETTANTAARLDVAEHTNHAIDETVALSSLAPSDGSRSRLARVQEVAVSTPATVEGMASVLADHGARGQDICVHPDPDDGNEGSTILFAMICEPETLSLWVAPGHPCTASFERFTLDELAHGPAAE